MKEWGWLRGGIALGLLSAFAFITYKPLGVSTSYPRAAGILLNPIAPDFVAENAYFQRVPPIVDWQLMLVLGIVVGGFFAARVITNSKFRARLGLKPLADQSAAIKMPKRNMSARRKVLSFFGGFLLLFGARLAGGCTSGHIITGFTQMATASFLFAAAVFAAGIPMAKLLNQRGTN